jgi:hypothetical protein
MVHYGRSTIANVETGRQNAPADLLAAVCDEMLGAGGALLEAYEQLAALVHGQRQAAALDAVRSCAETGDTGSVFDNLFSRRLAVLGDRSARRHEPVDSQAIGNADRMLRLFYSLTPRWAATICTSR